MFFSKLKCNSDTWIPGSSNLNEYGSIRIRIRNRDLKFTLLYCATYFPTRKLDDMVVIVFCHIVQMPNM